MFKLIRELFIIVGYLFAFFILCTLGIAFGEGAGFESGGIGMLITGLIMPIGTLVYVTRLYKKAQKEQK